MPARHSSSNRSCCLATTRIRSAVTAAMLCQPQYSIPQRRADTAEDLRGPAWAHDIVEYTQTQSRSLYTRLLRASTIMLRRCDAGNSSPDISHSGNEALAQPPLFFGLLVQLTTSIFTMTSHLQVEYNPSQAYNTPTSAVSTYCQGSSNKASSREKSLRPHKTSNDKLSHARRYTDMQSPLLFAFTSPAPGRPTPVRHFSDRLNVEHDDTAVKSVSLPFEHNMPPAALPTAISQQKRKNQLAGQGPFDLMFSPQNSRPYNHIGDPLLTQVPYAPVHDNLISAVDPYPHPGPSINYVRTSPYISFLYSSHNRIIISSE